MTAKKPTRHLALYRDYVGTWDRLELFKVVAERFNIARGLYPGSYVHITPSLVIPRMTYVDTDKRTREFFSDASVLCFVHRKRNYSQPTEVRYHHCDYRTRFEEPDASFDLLLSQWAGFVSQACKRYLKPGGILMTNNSHGDASMASLDPDYAFIGVVSEANKIAEHQLEKYFVPKKEHPLTREYIAELGRGVAYTQSATTYLFRRC